MQWRYSIALPRRKNQNVWSNRVREARVNLLAIAPPCRQITFWKHENWIKVSLLFYKPYIDPPLKKISLTKYGFGSRQGFPFRPWRTDILWLLETLIIFLPAPAIDTAESILRVGFHFALSSVLMYSFRFVPIPRKTSFPLRLTVVMSVTQQELGIPCHGARSDFFT